MKVLFMRKYFQRSTSMVFMIALLFQTNVMAVNNANVQEMNGQAPANSSAMNNSNDANMDSSNLSELPDEMDEMALTDNPEGLLSAINNATTNEDNNVNNAENKVEANNGQINLDNNKHVAENNTSAVDNTKPIINNTKPIIDNNKSVANNDKSIIDNNNPDNTIATKNDKKSDATGKPDANAKPTLKPSDVYSKAYIFSYPLVLFDATKKLVTHTTEPNPALMRAPINQFVHAKEIPAAELEIPDCTLDTLYSSAFLDLTKEPIILSLPSSDRFYLMQLLDAWTEVFHSAGTRTYNNQAANIALVGPQWKGSLPSNVQEVKSPTNYVWIIGRTEVKGEQDYDKVHEQQNNYKLIPLSAWGKDYSPPKVPLITPIEPQLPIEQVDAMDDVYYFTKFLSLMTMNPPHSDDIEIVEALRKVGINPGQTLDPTKMDGNQISGISSGFREAQQKLGAVIKNDRLPKKGWDLAIKNVGRYNTDYATRASTAFNSIGANLPQDIVFPSILTDSNGNPLRGEYDYVMHFDKDNLPPTNAFWSITMYDQNNLLVPNDLKRYSLNSRSNLVYNPDGSLDVHIKYDSPQDDFEKNWLPTPDGDFKLTMRIYWPKEALLDGKWTPPDVIRVETKAEGGKPGSHSSSTSSPSTTSTSTPTTGILPGSTDNSSANPDSPKAVEKPVQHKKKYKPHPNYDDNYNDSYW